MSIIKIQKKGKVTLPTALCEQVGIADGDLLEVRVHRGSFVLRPKVVIERSRFPTAADEYTPEQRRTVDRGINKSLEEYRRGKMSGPFDTHEEFITTLHKDAAQPRAKKTRKRARK